MLPWWRQIHILFFMVEPHHNARDVVSATTSECRLCQFTGCCLWFLLHFR